MALEKTIDNFLVVIKCNNFQICVPSNIILKETNILRNRDFSEQCVDGENKEQKKIQQGKGDIDEGNNLEKNADDERKKLGEKNKKRKFRDDIKVTETKNEKLKKAKKEDITIEIDGYQSEAVEKVFQYLLGNKKALICVYETTNKDSINGQTSTNQPIRTEDKLSKITNTECQPETKTEECCKPKDNSNIGKGVESSKTNDSGYNWLSGSTMSKSSNTRIFQPLSVYADMLKLCSEYEIKSPVHRITKYIDRTEINLDNLAEGVEASDTISMFEDLSEELFERCLSVANSNLTNCHILVNFLLNNKNKFSSIRNLLNEMFGGKGQDSATTIIRFNVTSSSKDQNTWVSPTYIINNFEWKIAVHDNKDHKGNRFLRFSVNCSSPDNPRWFAETTLDLKVSNYQAKEVFCLEKTLNHRFNDSSKSREHTVMDEEEIMRILKGGCFTVDVEITIGEEDGVLKNSHKEKKEECKFWYKTLKEIPINDNDMDFPKNNAGSEEPILLKCHQLHMVVNKDVLIRESKWFNTFFSWERNENKDSMPMDEKKRNPDEKSSYITLRKFDIDDSYCPSVVNILFDSLQRNYYSLNIKEYIDIIGLSDMIRLCDFYMINKFHDQIIEKMLEVEIDIVCLTETVEAINKLGELELYRNLADNLLDKCYHLAMANIYSRQVVMTLFVLNVYERPDAVLQILEVLGGNQVSALRFEFNIWTIIELESELKDYERFEKGDICRYRHWEEWDHFNRKGKPDLEDMTIFMMANNMTWKLGVSYQKKTGSQHGKFLAMSLTCLPPMDSCPTSPSWLCAVKFEFRLYKVCRKEYFSKEYEIIFSAENSYFQDKEFCNYFDEFDHDVFVDGDTYRVELVLNEVKISGNLINHVPEKLIRLKNMFY